MAVVGSDERTYHLAGTQRPLDKKREDEIARFIATTEAVFPNSIILAANYNEEGNLVESEEDRWSVEKVGDNGLHQLTIPKKTRIASIIDSQTSTARLWAKRP